MPVRKDKIKKVLNAFLGTEADDEAFDVVLDDEEIDLLATALDEALEK